MPKEIIRDIVTPGWKVELSWRPKGPGHDGHAQLASVNPDSPFEFPGVDTGEHFEAPEPFDGWRVTLDEGGLNALIRAAHKAKAQAFGDGQQVPG